MPIDPATLGETASRLFNLLPHRPAKETGESDHEFKAERTAVNAEQTETKDGVRTSIHGVHESIYYSSRQVSGLPPAPDQHRHDTPQLEEPKDHKTK
jgi:hypothetical protein